MTEEYRQILIKELKWQYEFNDQAKDIIIVVRNQYDHVKNCLDSLNKNTKNYNLFIWDNASEPETTKLLLNHNPAQFIRSEKNYGFVIPNNILAALTTSPYIILLNSDVVVSPGWDEALLGTIQANEFGVVGFSGRHLNEDGFVSDLCWGENVDYVEGWCMCIPRKVYEEIGLFDPEIKFAYCEDSDLCLRIATVGYKLYALNLKYVIHIGSATTIAVRTEMDDFGGLVETNRIYLQNKWKNHLMKA